MKYDRYLRSLPPDSFLKKGTNRTNRHSKMIGNKSAMYKARTGERERNESIAPHPTTSFYATPGIGATLLVFDCTHCPDRVPGDAIS